ncbi:MAG TPA: TMEM175 family protein [Vicinamibacterales bacterium]|nr:TMEM175 family protein [Vicinamibacterales bacterium]
MIRYREVSRLEGFSDAVFGFALTLLVVSLETPDDFAALKKMVYGFLPFALMFAMVCWIWYEHNVFFRRYGLQDPWTVFLNAVLLFVVLFYVYPLRFLTTAIVGQLGGMPDGTYASFQSMDMDGSLLMILYSTGVLLIFSSFLLLYRHAWQQRKALDLSALEEVQLKFRARAHGLSAGLAVCSLMLVFLLPRYPAFAGMIYGLMGPLHAWNGYRGGAAQAKVQATPPASPPISSGTS